MERPQTKRDVKPRRTVFKRQVPESGGRRSPGIVESQISLIQLNKNSMPVMRNPPSRNSCSLVSAFATAQISSTLRRLFPRGGTRGAPLDPDWATIPDTKTCREALEITLLISPTFLANHGRRSYFFGRQIACADRIKYDAEVLFLCCILHDWGLTETHKGPGDFEQRGACAAHAHLCRCCYPAEKSAIIYEAIAWHTAVGLAPQLGPEQALTHFGTGMDVIGYRQEALPPGFAADVVKESPRLGFKKVFHELLARECRQNPDTNFARMMKLGLGKRIENAPFPE